MKRLLLMVCVVVMMGGLLVGAVGTISAQDGPADECKCECVTGGAPCRKSGCEYGASWQNCHCVDYGSGDCKCQCQCLCNPTPTPTPRPPTPTPVSTPIPTPEAKPGIGYVTIRGPAETSLLIAKQWNGNSWRYPQYMSPENLNPPGPWSVHYILGAGVARFGFFERGTDHGQDQNPVWTTEVEVIAGKHLMVTVYDEELNLPDDKH